MGWGQSVQVGLGLLEELGGLIIVRRVEEGVERSSTHLSCVDSEVVGGAGNRHVMVSLGLVEDLKTVKGEGRMCPESHVISQDEVQFFIGLVGPVASPVAMFVGEEEDVILHLAACGGKPRWRENTKLLED